MSQADKKFFFVGEHLCADFINTQISANGQNIDLLENFYDLVAWLHQAHVLSDMQAQESLASWDNTPAAAQVLTAAKQLRQTIQAIIANHATAKIIAQSTLDALNQLLVHYVGFHQLVTTQKGIELHFHPVTRQAIDLMMPIAQAASDLVCNNGFSHIRKCENPVCPLYFLDTSKNHTRRWCSMAICGNRMKATAFYRRHRKKKD